MTESQRHRSTRLIARQTSELLFARWQRWQALVPETRFTYVVFSTVLSASIAHHPLRNPATGTLMGLTVARDRARPVNASAVALSMALSNSSVRRRADDLVETGLFTRAPTGYIVAPAFFDDVRLPAVLAADAADVTRVFQALREGGFAPAGKAIDRGIANLPPDVVARVLLAFALRSLETFAVLYNDFTAGAIAASIVAANIRHVTQDVVLARRYAAEDTLPPDEIRQPIALRELSRILDIPFETLRRRVATMVADGTVEWKGDGVIVPTRVLSSDRHIANNRRIARHFEQMIAMLGALATERRSPDSGRSADSQIG